MLCYPKMVISEILDTQDSTTFTTQAIVHAPPVEEPIYDLEAKDDAEDEGNGDFIEEIDPDDANSAARALILLSQPKPHPLHPDTFTSFWEGKKYTYFHLRYPFSTEI